MELYSFNQDKILNNYNKLLELYDNATSEEEKTKIYSNLKSLSRYIMHKKNPIIEPKSYKEELSQRRKQIISSAIELDSLTRELCYYWSNNLYQITSFHNSFLSSFRINKEEYLNTILTFIKENFSEDLSLVKRTFDEGKIQVKKSLIMSKSEMFVFEMLNDFYINIIFNSKFSVKEAADTIHEFGHASEFINRKSPDVKVNILEETVSTLYEAKYIEDYFKNDIDLRNLELIHLFKTAGQVNYLNSAFKYESNKEVIYREHFKIVQRLYAHIISLTLLNQQNFSNKVNYLKKYSSSFEPLELLKKININEDDLIYTAKNSKKLLLTRK